eukprot:CAMPEP_0170213180 /NCGR_PEP_ID=MMETSP0116_2-20130129/6211_1 /TAXON_ID=400756 /ORGANISM="Durinskia baltica, Strain CSIRO CS-38" /LENGTH=386 /DNA_ID=CAMNT_0010463725 /DNA_START=31 /DNA_END=1191 /DNA_ORIENTATION=+
MIFSKHIVFLILSSLFGLHVKGSEGLSSPMPIKTTNRILFDVPVSNNGARCRIIAYKKGIPESELTIMSPADMGGTKSADYLAINPQGKVPALKDQTTGLCVAESDTVSRFLLAEYAHYGPSFQPNNPISNTMARFHDIYLSSIQSCFYKPGPPFGTFGIRKDALKEYSKQLHILAEMMDPSGPYLCGKEVSFADATIFPSIVFAAHMFPKFDHGIEHTIPEKIQAWFDNVKSVDPTFQKVYDEMMGSISKWDEAGRWDKIHLAGIRDTDPRTIFDKIIAGEIPATVVKEDDKILAFKDINPAAPAHVLVIPKDRDGLTRLRKATSDHVEILGRLMVAAAEIARDESLGFGEGARIVINDGKEAGQEVFHLHVHVLGGRAFSWPPG